MVFSQVPLICEKGSKEIENIVLLVTVITVPEEQAFLVNSFVLVTDDFKKEGDKSKDIKKEALLVKEVNQLVVLQH